MGISFIQAPTRGVSATVHLLNPAAAARALLHYCVELIETDAAMNMEFLSELPQFDHSQNSRHNMADDTTDGPSSGAADDLVSEVRAKEHLRYFLRPAFP